MYVCVRLCTRTLRRKSLDSCIPGRSLTAKESEKYIPRSCRRHSRPTKELLCAHSKTIQLSWAMRKKTIGINRELQLAHIGRSSARLDTGCRFHFLHYRALKLGWLIVWLEQYKYIWERRSVKMIVLKITVMKIKMMIILLRHWTRSKTQK